MYNDCSLYLKGEKLYKLIPPLYETIFGPQIVQ